MEKSSGESSGWVDLLHQLCLFYYSCQNQKAAGKQSKQASTMEKRCTRRDINDMLVRLIDGKGERGGGGKEKILGGPNCSAFLIHPPDLEEDGNDMIHVK